MQKVAERELQSTSMTADITALTDAVVDLELGGGIGGENSTSDEDIQDAVGGILTDSGEVSLHYDDEEALIWAEILTIAQSKVEGLAEALAGKASTASLASKQNTITTANGTAAADVAMPSANTFYAGASVTLDAGVYLVIGHITVGRAATTLIRYTGRIRNTTDSVNYASTQMTQPSQNPHYVNMAMSCIITVTGTGKVVRLEAAANATACLIKAAAADNASGNNATQINVIKIS
jgi:hypothetical protein